MSDSGSGEEEVGPTPPRVVEYDPITGEGRPLGGAGGGGGSGRGSVLCWARAGKGLAGRAASAPACAALPWVPALSALARATRSPPTHAHSPPSKGVPAEYNAHLPHDAPEYKRWKAVQEGGAEALAALSLAESGADEAAVAAAAAAAATAAAAAAAAAAGQKKKKGAKAAPQVVLESATRNKKKAITTISGLDGFGVKLSEAAKAFGKKFACGASVVKNAMGSEEIDMQVGWGGCGDWAW
jgi:density-regulated protein DRP1